MWDLATGLLRHTWQHAPPRGILGIDLSRDGCWLFTFDEVQGEFESYRPRALSLWNVATGEHRQVVDGFATVDAMSPMASGPPFHYGIAEKPGEYGSICLYAMPEFAPRATLATEANQRSTARIRLKSCIVGARAH